jgi:hypothetical protein
MNKVIFTLFLAVVFSASFFGASAFAQDAAAPVTTDATTAPASADVTEGQFSYGTVVTASIASMKISEYDFETDTSEEINYEVATDVKLENVNSIDDIKQGDEVEIEFVIRDGKRTAVSIYVE